MKVIDSVLVEVESVMETKKHVLVSLSIEKAREGFFGPLHMKVPKTCAARYRYHPGDKLVLRVERRPRK